MSEPTMKDMARAGTWLNAAFGDRVTGAHLESLSWLLAAVRDEERERCARAIEEDRERVFSAGGPTLGELCIYDICALTVRQSAPCASQEKETK